MTKHHSHKTPTLRDAQALLSFVDAPVSGVTSMSDEGTYQYPPAQTLPPVNPLAVLARDIAQAHRTLVDASATESDHELLRDALVSLAHLSDLAAELQGRAS
jgi:hypothetical protein